MSSPILHLLVGPNGAGKSSFVEDALWPQWPDLPFVNADLIAAERWPYAQSEHAYDASRAAAHERDLLLETHTSFITETVFSHPSKAALVARAAHLGYLVHLHVVVVPVDLSVQRVAERVRRGGHVVPEDKIRARHARLWSVLVPVVPLAARADFYDNSQAATPFRLMAAYERGRQVGEAAWPAWAPDALRQL